MRKKIEQKQQRVLALVLSLCTKLIKSFFCSCSNFLGLKQSKQPYSIIRCLCRNLYLHWLNNGSTNFSWQDKTWAEFSTLDESGHPFLASSLRQFIGAAFVAFKWEKINYFTNIHFKNDFFFSIWGDKTSWKVLPEPNALVYWAHL